MMKRFLLVPILSAALLLLSIGCASRERLTYQTLATVVTIEGTAMRAWASHVVDTREALAAKRLTAGDDPQKLGDIMAAEADLLRAIGKVNVLHSRYQDIVLPAIAAAEAAHRAKSSVPAEPSWLAAAQAVATLVGQLRTR